MQNIIQAISNQIPVCLRLMLTAIFSVLCLTACSPSKNETPENQTIEENTELTAETMHSTKIITTPSYTTSTSNKNIKSSSPMIADYDTQTDMQATIIGEFSGKMRCTDCPYNKIYLQLNTDGTAEKILFHTAQTDMSTYQTLKGTYTQKKSIIKIKFDENPLLIKEELYRLEDHYLVQLTNELKVPTNTILVQD